MCLAIPGQIVELLPADTPGIGAGAVVEVIGVRRRIDIGLLQDDPPTTGDWVLIHVGFAMSRISESDAREQMEMLRRLGESDAAEQEVRGYGLDAAPDDDGDDDDGGDDGDDRTRGAS